MRERPIVIVSSIGVETACCIAASYEANAYGVKTGNGVHEAHRLYPKIRFVDVDHDRYVQVAKEIYTIIRRILFVDKVASNDETQGRLPHDWQPAEIAPKRALEIKAARAPEIGPHIGVSIGIALNRFIAKLASKLEKPNDHYFTGQLDLFVKIRNELRCKDRATFSRRRIP